MDASDVERLEQRVRSINGMAQMKTASQAKVPLEYVLGVGGFDISRIADEVWL